MITEAEEVITEEEHMAEEEEITIKIKDRKNRNCNLNLLKSQLFKQKRKELLYLPMNLKRLSLLEKNLKNSQNNNKQYQMIKLKMSNQKEYLKKK
jgi:hypothetical protein